MTTLRTAALPAVSSSAADDWRVPFSQALPSFRTRKAERFKRDILAVDVGIKVIIPEFLKSYGLEEVLGR